VVHDWLQLDGVYLAGLCCLIAAGVEGPVAWQWCDREKHASWAALLERVPPPQVVACDGQPGLLAAIKAKWPGTLVQRCLVHVRRDVRRHLTMRPKTAAGKALAKLSKQLPKTKTAADAAQWMARLDAWWQGFGYLTTEKTYRADVTDADVPAWAAKNTTWWYTHRKLRAAWLLMSKLARQGELFRYLDPGLAHLAIPATTNLIEGGVNAMLRRMLGHHRGMPPAHQRRAVEWWLWLHSARHLAPETLILPEHFKPPAKTVKDEPTGPAGYDTGLSAEEGLWARKGWAGRSHR
jgi:hypothetical protein